MITFLILLLLAGFSDGTNDAVIAGHFKEHPFWGINSWKNKYKYGYWRREVFTFTTDGFHLTKIITPACYSTAIAINIYQPQDWTLLVVKGMIAFFVFRAGHEVAYKIIFK